MARIFLAVINTDVDGPAIVAATSEAKAEEGIKAVVESLGGKLEALHIGMEIRRYISKGDLLVLNIHQDVIRR